MGKGGEGSRGEGKGQVVPPPNVRDALTLLVRRRSDVNELSDV